MTHQAFTVKELTALADGHPYREFLRRPAMSLGLYRLAVGWTTPGRNLEHSGPIRLHPASLYPPATGFQAWSATTSAAVNGATNGCSPGPLATHHRGAVRPGRPGAGHALPGSGCGSGDVSVELARRVGPDGSVVGIDMDAVKLALAGDAAGEASAEKGVDNLEFRTMNVYEWAEPGSYDIVYCRFLLRHLSRPVDVLRTMWQALRVGGAIVVEDADFEGSFCDPPNPGFAFWIDAYPRVLVRHGGDPQLGRTLHRLFPAAGIPTPAITLAQRTDSTGENKTLPYSTVWATAEAMVQEIIATAEEVEAALASLADFAADPASLCGSPRVFQAWSRRTRDSTAGAG